LTGGWIKVTSASALEPGEYAVVELIGDGMNTYVWDFGVNRTAPANVSALKPEQPPTTAQPDKPKDLKIERQYTARRFGHLFSTFPVNR
jgi:hypothetical protein